ncbi:PREDICTED: uncharacterized protein LOC105957625 isoform X1 [Erythranthe guttata]|uniref:uncharacterized protein LOC105957625 isoform X1 n=1 Tax=Erythranthe guttata TaxID=4155 RepID=UPI00064D8B6C|nr:PREDICTED: uncharacterized protein LOC105957625 isoform X1 [Erythranthe guttata]|eukprot:XP_012837023.1 PREDICTED: uncharacterized protein LOC105957625 isoform X1 [Erythranthe guttata]
MLRKCKRSLEMESSEEMRSFKFPLHDVPTKDLGSTNSATEENSDVKKWELVVKYNRKQKKVEKATDPGNEGSSQRITRPADQIHDKTPSEYTSIGKSTCSEKEQKGNCGCSFFSQDNENTIILYLRVIANVSDRQGCIQNPAFGSKEELLSKKMVQDVRPPTKKKLKKISSHKVAEKEYRDYLKVKASQLRQETFLLTRELQKRATMCMELTDANSLLMVRSLYYTFSFNVFRFDCSFTVHITTYHLNIADMFVQDELKKMYKPCVIDILEAKNPATNPQID